ncbi:MAG: hypothetical protein U0Q16_22830 [Bryobacteraceae bacterium]
MKAAVYDEILDFLASGTTPASLASFRSSEGTQRRVEYLIDRQRDGSISSEDAEELEEYLRLEHFMIMAKARARLRLKELRGE